MKIKNAFGALKVKWRILKYVDYDMKFIPTILTACCVLHNLNIEDAEFPEDEKSVNDGNTNDNDDNDCEPK